MADLRDPMLPQTGSGQVQAQAQSLSTRPSLRLHHYPSMPDLWHPSHQLALRRTPSNLRFVNEEDNGGQQDLESPLGLSLPTAATGGDGNVRQEQGPPFTPPMSPNAPTVLHSQFRQQQQQHVLNLSPTQPLSPTRFDPFSSYSSQTLPSPARSTHHAQQHVQEEHDSRQLNTDVFQVQFPRTEPGVSALEEDATSNSAQSTLVSPVANGMRLDSPAHILEYEGGGQRGGRLLLVGHVPPEASTEELKSAFSILGDLKGIFIRFQAEYGIVILAFFDMRHAAIAHRHIRSLRFFKEGMTLQSQFISSTEANKCFGNSSFVDTSEGEVYISTMGDGNLNQQALQNALASHGQLRQFRVVGSHGKAFFAEFFDTRDADAAVKELHDRVLLGVHVRLTHRPAPPILAIPMNPYNSSATISELQRQQDELALFHHFYEIVAAKQREDQAAAIEHVRTPEGVDIARGGPYDVSGGTLGRRGSFPGSSPRIDEREERFASLTDASSVFGMTSNDGQVDIERERKGSNVYGPDHHKAIIPSYPSPRTPSRESSVLSSAVHTPKRKISLPPFRGPLPLPPAQGNMAWPLPLPLRMPTPPNSASTGGTGSGGSNSSGADSPEFFIPTQTPPRRQGRAIYSAQGAQAAHAFLPASARSVLDLLRDPPPERNKIDLNRIREGLDTRTTVMLKNVPNKMTDKHLMNFIDSVCPKSYSFLYLRMDFENHCNVGYAFVNFIDVTGLLQFAEAKLGQKWGLFNSEKVLGMSYANYQGKEALVEKFRNSGVMEERESWRPKIFYSSGPNQGEPEPFPAPNNHLRQQRSFQNGRIQGLYSSVAPNLSHYSTAFSP